MTAKIMTRHPEEGKSGVNIDKAKYDVVRDAILASTRTHGEISFQDLTDEVRQKLEGSFEGSIPWYVVTVKLDLEARGEIERIPNRSPQYLRLVP